jgi:hypothetical protein
MLTVTGDPASRFEEVAHGVAHLLQFELVTEARLAQWLGQEFGAESGEAPVPDRAWRPAVASILARMAAEHHMVVAAAGSEAIFETLPDMAPSLLRAAIVAPVVRRVGNVMLDQRLERADAATALATLDLDARRLRKARLGRSTPRMESFDLILGAEQMDNAQMAEVLCAAATARNLPGNGFLPPASVAAIEFQTRLHLAKHGIVPAQRAHLKRANLERGNFSHPSEEMFANLLDFYRIQWQYEPRSFPLQWDKDGKAMEAFTPDFYLPEFDLYVELTTMKQSLVTRKNRKVKMLRAIYPHINIQVFYQKDFQDLVFKYGLRTIPS